MADIIIHKDNSISDTDALTAVLTIVEQGRISRNGECYCFCAELEDGIIVISDKRNADIFRVEKADPIWHEIFHDEGVDVNA